MIDLFNIKKELRELIDDSCKKTESQISSADVETFFKVCDYIISDGVKLSLETSNDENINDSDKEHTRSVFRIVKNAGNYSKLVDIINDANKS